MGATYTRQSSAGITDGAVIEASDINDEFDQLLAAFVAASGHTHDGTDAEGGPITKLLGTAITIGDATSGTDIAVTFDGESADGVLTWMEDEDYFKFSDEVLMNSTEKLLFGDTGTYIHQSADGVLDLVSDTEIEINATTIDINGAVAMDGAITGATNITLSGELDAATLDISGNADIDGTLEADAITINSTAIGSIYGVIAGSSSIVTTGALDSGSITSGFGTIDTGSSTITTTGLISGGSLDIDNVLINGTTIGHTDDTDLLTVADGALTVAGTIGSGAITSTGIVTGTGFTAGSAVLAEAELELLDGLTAGTAIASKVVTTDASIDTTGQRNLTISGELDAATGDFSGDVDVDGTLEADAYTLGGSAFIKIEGTNFTSSLLVGHATTGTLNSAQSNTGVGIGSLDALTSGDENTSTGYNSLTANTTGEKNTAFGSSTLKANISGTDNTAIGKAALLKATGSYNTALGESSGKEIVGGASNITIGNDSGDNITSGDGNVIIGSINADSATGDKQLIIADGVDGSVAWIKGDSSGNLTFPAEIDAATLDISGNADIDGTLEADAYTIEGTSFIKLAGTNFTGSLLLGHADSGTLDAAQYNTGVGLRALDALTSGDNNTGVGYAALSGVAGGVKNTSIGADSGPNLSSGSANTSVGFQNLYSNQGGNYNVAIGVLALEDATASNNTAVGTNSLKEVSDSSYNIGLGYLSGDNITTGDGNVIIGSVDAASATGDRQLMITGYDGTTTTTWIQGDSSGNVTMPAELAAVSLDISGAIDVDGTANLDIVDIDGAVDMATTLAVAGVSSFAKAANVAQGAITSSSNAVAWDASAIPNAYHITTENTTLSAPTNAVEGAFICIEINFNGSHTFSWNAIFNFAADTAPTTTDTDAKTDIFVFRYNGAIWQEVGRTLNIPES